MNRRSMLINSGKAAGAFALSSAMARATPASTLKDLSEQHVCGSYCRERVDRVARRIIEETGEWKQSLGRRGAMIVTDHGQVCCEIVLPADAQHPEWEFTVRDMASRERESFAFEYGHAGFWYLLGQQMGSRQVRGFIHNGRLDGWQLSVGV